MTLTNDEVAERFELMADFLEAQEVAYKPRAYRRAAESLRSQPGSVADLAREEPEALTDLEGVGDSIADKVVELVVDGRIGELEELREELPVEMRALTRVEGIGPKTVRRLYDALGITDLDDLQAAAEAGEIRAVSGFGEKTEQNILENVEFARSAGDRTLLGRARPVADDVLATLRSTDAVERCAVAGSIRRWKPTVGDVDVLAAARSGEGGPEGSEATANAEAVVDAFTDADRVDAVLEAGTTKAAVRAGGVRVDLRVVDPDQFGAALQYFTGSKEHNVRLRTVALDRGVSLNEYGAFDVSGVDGSTLGDPDGDGPDGPDDPAADAPDPGAIDPDAEGADRIAGETEDGMYEAVGLSAIPPEMREDRGEIAAAQAGELPDLVTVDDPRGDLHVHTDWSDGDLGVEATARAAAEFGHDYLAITDHATGPGMVGGVGLADEELREQMEAIRDLNEELPIDLLAGVEANVAADGSVSVGDDLLADLDLVVASPHSGLDRAGDATDRLVRAVEHPEVDVLGHPTGRLLDSRSGLTVDPAELGAAAAEAGVALEINSNPTRLDLDGAAVRAAVEAGARVAINTDAHRPGEFDNLRYGVHTARRGWAEPGDVITTWAPEDLRAFLS